MSKTGLMAAVREWSEHNDEVMRDRFGQVEIGRVYVFLFDVVGIAFLIWYFVR
jgi:hypothetical protein